METAERQRERSAVAPNRVLADAAVAEVRAPFDVVEAASRVVSALLRDVGIQSAAAFPILVAFVLPPQVALASPILARGALVLALASAVEAAAAKVVDRPRCSHSQCLLLSEEHFLYRLMKDLVVAAESFCRCAHLGRPENHFSFASVSLVFVVAVGVVRFAIQVRTRKDVRGNLPHCYFLWQRCRSE